MSRKRSRRLHYLSIENLCSVINSSLSWDEQWGGRSIQERICLTFNISLFHSIWGYVAGQKIDLKRDGEMPEEYKYNQMKYIRSNIGRA